MRTIELIKALTDNEVKLIAGQLALGKRKSLAKLFQELKKFRTKDTEPDRARLFTKIYEQSYSKERDYLLRNELRLLNDVVYEFITLKSFKDKLVENRSLYNLWLAQAYFDRKIELFEADINSFIQLADQKIKLDETTALCFLRSQWFISRTDSNRIKDLEGQITQWQEFEKRKFLYAHLHTEYSRAFLLQPNKPEEFEAFGLDADRSTEELIEVDLAAFVKNDWYGNYLALKKRVYQSTGSAQLNYSKKLYEVTGTKQAIAVLGVGARIKSAETIAFSLLRSDHFEEAETFMSEALTLSKKHKLPIGVNHLTNYIATLFILKRFKTAVDIFTEFDKEVKISPTYATAVILTAHCYLHLKQPDEALNILPPLTGLSQGEVLSIRYVYLIAFTIRKQYKLALNEAQNIKRMVLRRNNPQRSEELLEVSDIIHEYVKALSKTRNEQVKLINELKRMVDENPERYELMGLQNPELSWVLIGLKT